MVCTLYIMEATWQLVSYTLQFIRTVTVSFTENYIVGIVNAIMDKSHRQSSVNNAVTRLHVYM